MILTLFSLAGLGMVGWGLMILLPGWSVTRKVVASTLFPAALATIYAVAAVAMLLETGPGVIADFGSAEGVIRLLTDPDIALVAWIHILAFDHLVAVVIFRDNLVRGVLPLPLQSVVLFLTLMFGPVGFLTYWVVRVARGHGMALAPEVSAPSLEAA